jgi:hypothetical protein
MARIRSIKLDLFMDDGLAEVSLEAHFLLAGLPCLADSEGRLEDRPRRIQAQIFPYRREVDVDRCLEELAKSGHVRRYEAAGVRYLQVENWDDDQRPHVKEAPSSIPAPLDSSEHRQGGDVAGNSPGTRRGESAGILGVGSGVLGVGSGDLSPPSSAPRNELRLESQEAPRQARKRQAKPETATDPRHAPLARELASVGWAHHGGRTARAIRDLLALANQHCLVHGGGVPEEVLRRAAIARAYDGFPRVRELHELVAHWGHFADVPRRGGGGGPAPPSSWDLSKERPPPADDDEVPL